LDTTTLEEFKVNWLLQNGDAGAGTLFAQIQDQGTPPNVEDMTLDCNAKKAIIVLPVTPHVTPPGPAAAVSAADGLEPA
jgi:hypothetical protein